MQNDTMTVNIKTPFYKEIWFVVLLLVAVPPIGLAYMWLMAPWKKYIKALVTVPVFFASGVWLLMTDTFIQSAIKDATALQQEPVKMERFLEEKYGQDFVIKSGKITKGGDGLFGIRFKTYEAEVSPVRDDKVVFKASRIIEGRTLDGDENSPDKINYQDNFLLNQWTHELEGLVITALKSQPVEILDLDFSTNLALNRSSVAGFYENIWGTSPHYSDLPLKLRQALTLSSAIKVVGKMDAKSVESYAAMMIAVRDALDPDRQGLNIAVTSVEVYADEKAKNELGKWQNTHFIKLKDVASIDELTPYFVRWTDGYGMYYNPKTRQFDMNHPE